MVKTRNRPESRSKREKVSERVTDIIATTRKWLFPDGVSLKHIRDVAHRLPRERQKHFIHKFSSMERLRSFCTLADNARATSSTLSEDILKSIIQENGEIELSRHLLFILHQRLPSLRHRITELKKENSYHLLDCVLKFPESCEKDLQHEYLRLLITGKCKSKQWKADVESLMRKATHLHIPNSFKTDIKILFDTGKTYDAIVIPSDSVGTMVIPLSIHPDEIETLSTISYRKNVHRLILSSRSAFFRKLFDRRTDCPLGHISLVVLDSSIIPSHLLKIVLSFFYTNELPSLDMDSSESSCDLASDCELADLSISIRRAVALFGVGKILQLTSLIQAAEDKIVHELSYTTVLPLLQWAERDHGSSYISRNCMAFIRENFHHLSQTGILTGLTTEEMIKLLQDDYLQAHELDVLRAALRWAENAAREKEPDIIKKRKKEPSNDLIRNALAPLLPYIRLEYILPANCPDLAKVFQSGLILNPPTAIDGSTTIGRGWDYGDSRSPRFYKPYVEIFLELNANEWSEETCHGNETVPRANLTGFEPQIVQNCAADEILEQSLILPSETTCCQVLKRLHSLQQKYQPIIPRHMHFLRLTALREHSLPEGLITVLRDPCQYYPGSKHIKHHYALVQRYRYYKKLNDNVSSSVASPPTASASSRPSSGIHQPPDILGSASRTSTLTNSRSPQKPSASTLVRLMQSPVRRIRQNFKTLTTNFDRNQNHPAVIDYIPSLSKGSKVKTASGSTTLPDIATTSRGIENLTYRTSSSNSSTE